MLIPALWETTLQAATARRPLTFFTGLRFAVPAGNYCPLHSHAAVEIIYHATGRGVTRVAGRAQAFSVGSVLVHAPGEWHDQTMEVQGEDLCIQITLPVRAAGRLRQGFHVAGVETPWLIEEMQQLSRESARPGGLGRHILDLRATAVLLELARHAVSASRSENLPAAERHVIQAEHYIGQHFATLKSLNDVAAHVGISPDHLRHIFRKQRGESLVGYLGKVRVARAKTLLKSSPFPLKQIAGLCGFRDEYYFSAAFRRIARLSPAQYRRAA
jgi:AraC-like DNA-binding protein